ncbi:MAG: DUF3551 domain-containing protein [Alphaproteobacteria bacterium]|nr:MAG: DUF3551 domain-containing protein [Alphaproteobacteria bacterium]HYS83543.1 DUF3551 domain-containing protein [Bradyrhizobium sp.]
MRTFTFIALACLTVAFAGGTRADAADREAWCAYYEDNAGTNCGFATFEQCQADISGVGGYCAPNPDAGQ